MYIYYIYTIYIYIYMYLYICIFYIQQFCTLFISFTQGDAFVSTYIDIYYKIN